MTEETLFQQLVEQGAVDGMIEHLESLEWDDEDERKSIQVPFREEDTPRVLEELREMQDGG